MCVCICVYAFCIFVPIYTTHILSSSFTHASIHNTHTHTQTHTALFTPERSNAPDALARNQIRTVLEQSFEVRVCVCVCVVDTYKTYLYIDVPLID